MKKRIVTLITALMILCAASFANNGNDGISQKVLTAFTEQFIAAKTVSWSITDNYFKATFTLNDQSVFAYFLATGELIGISRNIISNQLPINLETSLKLYKNKGWIVELFEFAGESETNYFATVENAKEIVMLKSSSNNSWTVYRKSKKS